MSNPRENDTSNITWWGQPVQRTFRRTLCHYGKIRIIIPTLRTTKDRRASTHLLSFPSTMFLAYSCEWDVQESKKHTHSLSCAFVMSCNITNLTDTRRSKIMVNTGNKYIWVGSRRSTLGSVMNYCYALNFDLARIYTVLLHFYLGRKWH